MGLLMEGVRRIWIGGINPPLPFSENHFKYANFVSFKDVETLIASVEPDDYVVISDVDQKAIKAVKAVRNRVQKTVLIRNEPQVVCPKNYRESTISLFDEIVDVGRTLLETTYTAPYAIAWPTIEQLQKNLYREKLSEIVFMNSNKLSFVKGELYSLRRIALKSRKIWIYGPGWSSSFLARIKTLVGELLIASTAQTSFAFGAMRLWFSKYENYLGLAENKLDSLSAYKVALTIENSADYMSEKLMDALLAGCIPVYVGPDPNFFKIPSSLVVHANPTFASISRKIDVALSMDFDAWQVEAEAFLISDETKDFWSQATIYTGILEKILDGDDE